MDGENSPMMANGKRSRMVRVSGMTEGERREEALRWDMGTVGWKEEAEKSDKGGTREVQRTGLP